MPGGMSGRFIDLPHQRTDAHLLALAYRDIDQRNALGLPVWSNDPAPVARFELGNAAGVVGVVMGDEDVGELPAFRAQGSLDRSRLGSIDGGRGTGRAVVEKDAVIILQTGKKLSLCGHWQMFRGWVVRARRAPFFDHPMRLGKALPSEVRIRGAASACELRNWATKQPVHASVVPCRSMSSTCAIFTRCGSGSSRDGSWAGVFAGALPTPAG